MAALLDANRDATPVQIRSRSALGADEDVYLSGGMSQSSRVGLNDEGQRDAAAWDEGGLYLVGEDEEENAAAMDAPYEVDLIELAVDQVSLSQQAAERIELAVRAVRGVLSVTVSETTGRVSVEAAAAPWMGSQPRGSAGRAADGRTMATAGWRCLNVLYATRLCGSFAAKSISNGGIEDDIKASQAEVAYSQESHYQTFLAASTDTRGAVPFGGA